MSTPRETDRVAMFADFEFDKDDRWVKYRCSVDLPAGNEEVVLTRLKARWYARNVDTHFDPDAFLAKFNKPGPLPKAASESKAGGGGSGKTAAPKSPGAVKAAALNSGRQRFLFFAHIGSLVLSFLSLMPLGGIFRRCYKLSLQLSALTFIYKIYIKNGVPKLRPFLASLKEWIASVMMTSAVDFQYMFLCLLFMTQRPMTLVLVPPGTLAAYHASAYLYQHYSESRWWQLSLKKPHEALRSKQTSALTFSAGAEVAIAPLLLFQLLTPARNILQIVVYWNYLKMRYAVPDPPTNAHNQYHHKVWVAIGRKINPYADKFLAAKVVVRKLKSWFLAGTIEAQRG